MASIPASQLVNVVPSVLSAGGTALDLNGLILTQSARAPVGAVLPFPSPAAVGAYFGLGSQEYGLAQVYFAGFTGSNTTPGSLLLTRYPEAAVGAFLRGGVISGMTLATLQALSGSLGVTVDGHVFTTAAVSLSTATSFSSAAALLQTALNATLPNGGTAISVNFDSISGALVIASGTTGAASTIATPTGSLASSLMLTPATGAILSQGADAAAPGAFMAGVVSRTANWCAFTTTWEPALLEGEAFAAWTSAQGNRYLFAAWNTDAQNTVAGSTSTLAYAIGPNGTNSSGISVIHAPVNGAATAAFVLGAIASIDFTETNGRTTLAYKNTPGLAPDVVDGTQAANLKANGVNYYGSFATGNEEFTFLYPGSVTGPFAYIDSFVNQVWLNNELQLAVVVGLTQSKSVPYAAPGYTLITAWLTDPVEAARNFGAVVPGVALSAAQVAELKAMAGIDISQPLTNRGYYLQVKPANAQTRAARRSPPCTVWYLDGGSVQQISLASVEVQ